MIATANISDTLDHQSWEFETQLQGGLVVGVDGSPESIAAVNNASALARHQRSVLHVV